MRVADKMSHDQVLRNVSQNRSDMNDLQNQAATQKRVTKPSDDPVAASRLLSTRIDLQGTKQYLKTLNYAQSFLNYTDQSLDDLTQNLVRLKELIIAQSNDASSNKDTRRVVATEVDQIFQQVVKIGNRKLADRFIFGGYKTTRPPFDGEGIYKGDQGEMLIGVDKQNYVAMNLPGSKVFLGEGLSRDGISHATTEQPATIEEYLQETVDKAIEEQRVSQQIQHNLQDEDLKVQDDNQEQVQNRGPASVESTLRSIIGRDPNSIERDVEVNGTNLFSLIKKVNVALRTDDKIALQNSLEKIDDAISQVVLARSQVGARSMALTSSLDGLQKMQVDANDHISKLEDADAFKVVSDINKTESTLQATLQTSGKMIQKSLMDFVR